MKRRTFLGLLTVGLVGLKVNPSPLWYPTQKQLDFINSSGDVRLYGIPYHMSDASTGTWLGISRS